MKSLDPTPIRVLLFGRYAELLGADHLTVPVPVSGTVEGVVDLVRQLPGGQGLPDRPLAAIDLVQVPLNASVRAGVEVALLPPMAGG